MKISEILPKFQNARKASNGFLALCPAHDDQKQSLSIKELNGKILLKCFAGCDVQNIISAVGLTMQDLFDNSGGLYVQTNGQARRIAETYDYTDADGKLLFQAVRYEPKGFAQRRPDGKGGWIWNLKNIEPVIYHLPEVLAASLVFICEGEKDVEAIRKNDYSATCNPQGALKWRDEYSVYFISKTVVILPDNDDPGKRHALQVANLLHGIAKEIIILELPNLKPKGDVSDFFEEGGTIDDIIGLLEKAEAWQPDDQQTADSLPDDDFESLFKIQDANTWLSDANSKPIPKMLFGEFWFEGELCILFADTGKGKSILAVQIADSISKGLAITSFTLEAQKQVVLYFDFELSEKQFEARYSVKQGDVFTNHYEFDENFKRGEINQNSFVPDRFKDFQEYLNFSLEFEIADTGATVLIVDNITFLKNATETAKDALPLMKELIRLKKKYGISILALAHTPKRDLSRPLTVNDLQGSKMLSNFADSIFAIGESAKDKNLRYLKQIKARNTEIIFDAENVATCQIIKPDNFLMFEFLTFGNEREHLKILSDADKDDLIQKVKNLSLLGKSQREIATELGISPASVNRYLRK